MRLLGKTALITGSARGIGLEIAVMMAKNGANVIVNTRNEETLAHAAATVRERAGQAKVGAFLADVGDKAQVEAMFDYAVENFGQVDIIVNNAAIAYAKPFLLYDDDWWNEMLRVNLNSVYYICHRGVREMIKKGVAGSIINFSSIGATKPHRQMLAYDTCKGAVETFTRALALEVAPWEIRVNAISPASIIGFYVKEMDPGIAAKKDPGDFLTPLPRQGTPEDVANLAVFLASNESAYITGQVIPIDGGMSVQARHYPASKVAITPQNIKEKNIIL